jgi:hypothetical protein
MTLQHNLNAVQDPYRAVSLVLLVAAILGMWAAFVGGIKLTNPVMLASGITLGLAALILAGVLRGTGRAQKPACGGSGAKRGRARRGCEQRQGSALFHSEAEWQCCSGRARLITETWQRNPSEFDPCLKGNHARGAVAAQADAEQAGWG